MCRLPSSSSSTLVSIFSLLLAVGGSTAFAATSSAPTSAFLQAQTASPIKWLAWSDEAFARAKAEGKPVYLAIGSFTSELSRAMARQSFSNPETAAYLNENFVCILVDAKERPDVFALYQNFTQATKQVSGPPLNIWLTSELKPFEGSNYLPPTEEWGKEGIVTTMKRVETAWKTDPAAQRRKAQEAIATTLEARSSSAPGAVTPAEIQDLLKTATETTRARFDATHAGFGDAPKYIEPELLRFLLRDPSTRDHAVNTLRVVVNSSLLDPLDGGFFRYAVDPEWHQPYFQKLLTDQARVALALLEAAVMTKDSSLAEAARGALKFALADRSPEGEYVAAEDAAGDDLAGIYLWTNAEIREALGDKAGAEFAAAYGVTAEGNLPEDAISGVVTKGKNLLRRVTPLGDAAAEKALADSAAKLLQRRKQRPAPRRDVGAPSAAHGLMLSALARAANQLSDVTLLAAAKAEAAFIREHLRGPGKTLLHLADQATPASPTDYALVIDGLQAYAELKGGDADAPKLASALLNELNMSYRDPTTARFFTTKADAGPAFWGRLYTPAPTAGELPSPEATLLATATGHAAFAAENPDLITSLQRIGATELKNAGEIPPADWLLALRPAP